MPRKEWVVFRILRAVFGVSAACRDAEAKADRILAKRATRPRPEKRIPAGTTAMVLAALALAGCQMPTQDQTTPATAPVFNGIGINAARGAEVWIDGASPDQSGNVAAQGDARQDARQVTQIDPAAVAKGLADVADVVVPAGRAAAMLARAEEALNSGDVRRADILGRAARGLAEKEAADAEAEKSPPPAPPAPGSTIPPSPGPTPAPEPGTP